MNITTSMAIDFRPFQAWRYNLQKVELGQVISPPYDVISPSEKELLYQRSPFNVIRLILGKEADFYESAHRHWEDWASKGILVQEGRPAFYLYEQNFKHPLNSRPMRRFALVGKLKLDSSEGVLRHEATFSAPRKDRFLLLEKTQTNLSPIFGLYQDSKKTLQEIFSSYLKKPTLFQTQDDQGVLHRGWAIEKGEEQKAIHQVLTRDKILIADGHHRYETALEYQRVMRQKNPNAPPDAPFDFVMMALVEFGDEGLLVLPTHRVIRSFGSLSKTKFVERLRSYFLLNPCSEKELFQKLEKKSSAKDLFGVTFGKGECFLLELKNLEAIRPSLPQEKPPVWFEVEANLLTYFVFGTLWGIPEEERRGWVEYTHSSEEAIQKVLQEKAEAAFLLRSPEVDIIRKLADTGEKMPQKTTYFYPKLTSGLFFYHHGN